MTLNDLKKGQGKKKRGKKKVTLIVEIQKEKRLPQTYPKKKSPIYYGLKKLRKESFIRDVEKKSPPLAHWEKKT